MAAVCTNPDCRLAETGKCVDGFEIGKCPHVIQDDDVLEVPSTQLAEEIESSAEITDDPNTIVLNDGEILNIDSAADVLRSGPTRVITVIGPSDSGKTTFALSLYDAFQNGPFDKWEFAGSMTLPAFEKRSHMSRAKCGNSVPNTHRTPISDGLGFLHLAIHNEDIGRLELLISDRSGEHYRDVANGVEGYENLHEVSRADYVLFFVDGKKLASDDERHGVKNDVVMLIRSLVEANVLGKGHSVGVVLTKYDFVHNNNSARAEKDFHDLMAKLHERYDSSLAIIKEFKIAARSENENIPSRHGIAELLEDCISLSPKSTYIAEPVSLPNRIFLRLKVEDGGTL